MSEDNELHKKVKKIIVESLRLKMDPEEITDDLPLFEKLGLESDSVSTEQLINIPVTGSSELISAGAKSVHWEPVAAGADFRPTDRFSSWSEYQHARFNGIAGKQMTELAYQPKSVSAAMKWRAELARIFDLRRLVQLRPIRRFLRKVGS